MNYKEILQNIITNGSAKQPTRIDSNGNIEKVENSTIGTFCEIFRHDMSKGFPLTTLRKMPFKSMCVELEGFIKGITDKSWFQERKCKFWDEWANPVQYQKELGEEIETSGNGDYPPSCTNDLGPIYGYQWRNFGAQYGEVLSEDYIEGGCCPATGAYQEIYTNVNGLGFFSEEKGIDQLKSIVDKIKQNPYDRRMVCSAWNPNQMHLMALPPCHWGWNVVVYGDKLNLVWHQRSVDASHGLPNNIASYGLLLLLLCEESGLKPGELVGTLADCHLYSNTLEPVKELIERNERKLPTLKIKRKEDGSFSIFDWTYQDVELIDYDPHPAINMGKVTV